MSILQGFFLGIGAYGKAIDILFSRGFLKFLIFPFLFLLLLFWGGDWLVSVAGNHLSEVIKSWIEGVSWLSWLNDVTGILMKILLKVLYFFLFLTFGAYILLVVMSPVYSWLSEKTEARLTGKTYPFHLRQLLWEIMRGILIAIRNMFLQLGITLLLFLFSFIPVIGLLSPFALFLVSAYFYGFSFVDYSIERKRFNIKESVRYINKNAGMVTGIGFVFALSLMVPCISIVVGSVVSLLSVVAGAIVVDRFTSETKKPSQKTGI